MTQTYPPYLKPFLQLMLFILAFCMGMETGAGTFVTVVVFPVWASSAEAAVGFVPSMPYHFEEGDFFMYASSLTMLASVITLIAGWRAPSPLRKWILIATIGFIIVFIWSVLYFIPIQDTSLKGPAGAKFSTEELESKLTSFVQLNYLRIAMLWVTLFASLHALRLSYRVPADKRMY
jgi:hypothetical protein